MNITTGLIAPLEGIQHVPKNLTRKTAPGQAFVTGWRRHDDGVSHTVLADWPAHHPLYTSHKGHYHPLILSETIRQALALLSHVAHDIPLDFRLGWESYDSSAVPTALRTGPDPAHVRLTVSHTEVDRHRRGSVRLATQITATRDGEPLGIARVRYTAVPPAIYDRLRGAYADARASTARALPVGPALDDATRGRQTSLDDAVLSPLGESHRWQLRVNTANRSFFDHAHDHIPGLVFLEAAAQAAQALSGAAQTVPTEFDARFVRYVELDAPCWIEATPLRRGRNGVVRTEVTGHQAGSEVFSVRVTALEHA
ncbi:MULTISPECIES: ScbA/BarX family gamma-butyrolactone biosynthesis protein [unclassified Streptomyces]|uniref:ScbA/BarX family gamma-butyrolactone biosynthesis protein n=1 Tax=unclassified Streptomyces TaxID=2593676 RepID=UPI0004C395E0